MKPRRSHIAGAALLLLGAVSMQASAAEPAAPAPAERDQPLVDEFDRMTDTPREARGVEVIEKLGATLPLDLSFKNERGQTVTLGRYFESGKPVILTFNYSACEMLCSLQLGKLAEALAGVPIAAGQSYHIVTIGLDPEETPERSRETKGNYLDRFADRDQRAQMGEGWHFLTGDEASIKAVADAVGYRYRYLEARDEYIHPAALTFVSSRGTVNQYLLGIQYDPDTVTGSIMKAGLAEPQDSIGFVLSCFHYDSDAGSYAKQGRDALKYGGLAFIALMLGAFGTWHIVRSRREPDGSSDES